MKVIEQFQNALVSSIKNEKYLEQEISYVSFLPTQNPPLPHILIGDIETNFSYLHERMVCEINFTINLYSRGLDQAHLQKIHQKINEALTENNLVLEGFQVTNIKELKFSIEIGKDLSTTRLQMYYKAIVR